MSLVYMEVNFLRLRLQFLLIEQKNLSFHLGTPKNNFVMVASLSTLGMDGFATKVPPTSRRFKNTTCSVALFPLEQVRIPQSG